MALSGIPSEGLASVHDIDVVRFLAGERAKVAALAMEWSTYRKKLRILPCAAEMRGAAMVVFGAFRITAPLWLACRLELFRVGHCWARLRNMVTSAHDPHGFPVARIDERIDAAATSGSPCPTVFRS